MNVDLGAEHTYDIKSFVDHTFEGIIQGTRCIFVTSIKYLPNRCLRSELVKRPLNTFITMQL